VWKLGGSAVEAREWKAGAFLREECDSLGYELSPHATTTYVYLRLSTSIYLLDISRNTESPRDQGITEARSHRRDQGAPPMLVQ
jgi:hypothetical protein